MKKKDLIKQLQGLSQKIKPDLEWQRSNRDILVAQINAQTGLDYKSSKVLSQAITQKIFMAVLKPIAYAAVILLAIGGSWTVGANATKNSLPGDLLYSLKLSGERLQVNLTLNDEKRTNLEIAFATKRLDEIQKVMNKPDNKSKENLDLTLQKFQESMANVKTGLSKLELSNKDKAIKVANLVDEKAKVFVDLLQTKKPGNTQVNQNTQDAITVSKAIGEKAVSVLLNEFEAGNGNVTLEEVTNKVNTKIESLEKELETAKINIAAIIINKAAAAEKAKAQAEAEKASQESATPEGQPETTSNTNQSQPSEAQPVNPPAAENTNQASVDQNNTEETLPTLEEMDGKIKEAESFIAQAKELLKNSSVTQAFEQINKADELITLINKVIAANSQYLEVPGDINPTSDSGANQGKAEGTVSTDSEKS